MNPDGRMHYFCAGCWEAVEHGPELSTGGVVPVAKTAPRPPVGKACCFCSAEAKHRARSHTKTQCPAGHMPPEQLEAIFARVESAAKRDAPRILAEESLLYGLAREEDDDG